MAKQCHLEGDISESWHWSEALSQKLDSGQDVFVLVTGFENGPDESRGELAGELRQLNERYPLLRLVMMGGQRLAALKYANGDMSLLNIAEELPIPQLANRDLYDLFGQQYPQLNLSPAQLQTVLDFTGCHPRLLQYCLQQGADSAQACDRLLRQSPVPISKQALNPGPDFGPYGLPKAALVALVRQYAIDHGADGIRANAVNADRVNTGLYGDGMLEERAAARGLSVADYLAGANPRSRPAMKKSWLDFVRRRAHTPTPTQIAM